MRGRLEAGSNVAVQSFQSEAVSRGARMLRTALGPAIAAFLEDPAIVEVMLNPDGRLWIDRFSTGLADTGERLSAALSNRPPKTGQRAEHAHWSPARGPLSLCGERSQARQRPR